MLLSLRVFFFFLFLFFFFLHSFPPLLCLSVYDLHPCFHDTRINELHVYISGPCLTSRLTMLRVYCLNVSSVFIFSVFVQ